MTSIQKSGKQDSRLGVKYVRTEKGKKEKNNQKFGPGEIMLRDFLR